MKYQTEMMRAILQNETAQEIIDYVSQIYGESYVALWVYEVIGSALDEVLKLADSLREEAGPGTSDFLLDYWEEHYGLPRDSSLTNEQRRARLLRKIQNRAPMNPEKLAAAVSAVLDNLPVSVEENTAHNTFTVDVFGEPTSLAPGLDLLNRMKPAHLLLFVQIYTHRVYRQEVCLSYGGAIVRPFYPQPVGEDRTETHALWVKNGGAAVSSFKPEPVSTDRAALSSVSVSRGGYLPPSLAGTQVEVKRAVEGRPRGAGGLFYQTHTKSKLIE